MTLRPYQTIAIERACEAIQRGKPSGLWAMPTGCGKTVTFVSLAQRLSWPTLILVHRDELIRQTVRTAHAVWPEASVGVIQQERNEWHGIFGQEGPRLVIASVPSLHEKRRRPIPTDRFGLIVVDEAHHAVADSYLGILCHFIGRRFCLGCTATPERADRRGLADVFGDEPLYVYPLMQAIHDGFLCRVRQVAVGTGIDLNSVHWRCGDFVAGELEEVVNTPERNRKAVEAYAQYAAGRRAIVFGVDVKHAWDLSEAFIEGGYRCEMVSGETPIDERRARLARFAAGEIDVLTNCAVLTEGFDDPGISAVIMCRPTASKTLYIQCVGRGLRLAPSKPDCIIIDLVDNCVRHKMITATSLVGAQAMNAEGRDIMEVAEQEAREAEERSDRTYHPLTLTDTDVSPWPEAPSLVGYVPTDEWEWRTATDRQVEFLRKFGVRVERELSRGEASWLINRCLEYDAAFPAPATSGQQWFLRKHCAWRPGMTKREARQKISEIKNGVAGTGLSRPPAW